MYSGCGCGVEYQNKPCACVLLNVFFVWSIIKNQLTCRLSVRLHPPYIIMWKYNIRIGTFEIFTAVWCGQGCHYILGVALSCANVVLWMVVMTTCLLPYKYMFILRWQVCDWSAKIKVNYTICKQNSLNGIFSSCNHLQSGGFIWWNVCAIQMYKCMEFSTWLNFLSHTVTYHSNLWFWKVLIL